MTSEEGSNQKHARPQIFKTSKFPIDLCHVKAIMPLSNIDQEMLKKYYSPSAVSLSMVLEASRTLESFYGKNLLEQDNAKIFFPKDTIDPILVLYNIPVWGDGKYEQRSNSPLSMVIAIAPRARLPDEKTDDYPMLSEVELKEKEIKA